MDVAIYLRKSRDESGNDDVLSKHRDTLVAMCNDWNYTLYEEIASGERIASRPVMQRLLSDVQNGKYESVLVMDIDRLGRGNNKDWGIIYEAFCNDDYNTLIVTPQRTYDLTEDTDEMMVDMQSLFAKMEYKAIKKRMMRGKIAGAKQGKWVCGNPPYPYVNINGKIDVDQEKCKVYRMMIDMAVNGSSLEQIKVHLNQSQIKTPSGIVPTKTRGWNYPQVKRLLTDEVHLGYIVYGKSKGDCRKNNFQKLSRDQWLISDGSHKPLKTQEEHDKIIRLIADRRTVPVAARAGKNVLSGLLYCKKCGHTMRVTMTRGKYKCVQCRFRFADGSVCQQRGSTLADPFVPNIISAIFTLDEERLLELREINKVNTEVQVIIKNNIKEIEKCDNAIERIYTLYEDGEITKEEFINRKKVREQQKLDLQESIDRLKETIVAVDSSEEFLRKLKTLRTEWQHCATDTEKNSLLKAILQKIVYDRNGEEEPVLEIYYK